MKNLIFIILFTVSSVSIVYPMETEANYSAYFEQETFVVIKKVVISEAFKQFACAFPGCKKSFTQKNNLVNHMSFVHTKAKPYVEVKPYACTIEGCGKSFALNNSLTRHLSAHRGEKPYACTIEGCGQLFSRSNNLARHLRTHNKNEQY